MITLEKLDPNVPHEFVLPSKKIHEEPDVSAFLVSRAYRDLTIFLSQLNRSVLPQQVKDAATGKVTVTAFELGSANSTFSTTVQGLAQLIADLNNVIKEAPPDSGPRRFGNLAFRKWYEMVIERSLDLLRRHLPASVLQFKHGVTMEPITELQEYFLGSFGSKQRLDYGTGHELSFLAFLAGIWKLGGFANSSLGGEERAIVFGVVEPYLALVRRLIMTYNLEPAGSHGVWGLDDHSFLPYIFGSAQYGRPITENEPTPTEGSIDGAPDPHHITRRFTVEQERSKNMYFSAIGFIYDVKTGPFWEHSRTLYDISGVKAGWSKINKGMIKMYHVEVMSKLPVVQHFPFGSLFSFDRDPDAVGVPESSHSSNQPQRSLARESSSDLTATAMPVQTQAVTSAPWAVGRTGPPIGQETQAPWARTPLSKPHGALPSDFVPTKAPWAK